MTDDDKTLLELAAKAAKLKNYRYRPADDEKLWDSLTEAEKIEYAARLGAEKERDACTMGAIPAPKEIAMRLRSLSRQMQDLGAVMEYTAGFDGEMAAHGKELLGAGLIANGWAAAIEEEMQDLGKVDGRPVE